MITSRRRCGTTSRNRASRLPISSDCWIEIPVTLPSGGAKLAIKPPPGSDGNVTGISIQQSELIGKRLALLREVVPHLRRLVIMANAGYAMPVLEAQEAKATAQALGLEAARPEIWRSEDITPAFEAIRGKADALYVVSDPLIAANRTLVTTLALSARLPTMLSYGDYVAAGGLMSYGPNFANLFRRAADMVDKILRGTKPGDIPVEQPGKFELAINLETAKALGITVPVSLLATAVMLRSNGLGSQASE